MVDRRSKLELHRDILNCLNEITPINLNGLIRKSNTNNNTLKKILSEYIDKDLVIGYKFGYQYLYYITKKGIEIRKEINKFFSLSEGLIY